MNRHASLDQGPEAAASHDAAVVIVSYNTTKLLAACLHSLLVSIQNAHIQVVVIDNASQDGSAEMVAANFPEVQLIRSAENLGFARAINFAAEHIQARYLLLLNPDTEVHDGAVESLLAFAELHSDRDIFGGRTVFPDGSLNVASCLDKITPWSAFCRATGLSVLFRGSMLLNPEGIGGWNRDSVREVDIVVGCFMLVRIALWRRLGGFDPAFWMYGEEADFCLRATRLTGRRPLVTPEATIMHIMGATSPDRVKQWIWIAKARTALIRRHWPRAVQPWGLAMERLWAATRLIGAAVQALRAGPAGMEALRFRSAIWRARGDWLKGW